MMNRILLLMLLALALPSATFANSVNFTNEGGTLSGTSAGLSMSGSTLIAVGSLTGPDLGSVTFSTGALTSGSLQGSASFAAGGSFVITGNGSGGLFNGTIFTGTFSGPVTWTESTLADGQHSYTLQGAISGIWDNGKTVTGSTVQLTITTKGFFTGSTTIVGGGTNFSATTPEPGSLIFFGTGLVGMAAVLRRKKT